MISRSMYTYFWFGTCIRYLQDAQAGFKLEDKNGQSIIFNLESLFNYLDILNLQVTKRASYELKMFYDSLLKLSSESVLTMEQADELRKLVISLRKTLEAELQGFETHIYSPKRLDVNKLTTDVPSLFAPGIFDKLPSVAQYDLQEAGKCIAFERSTAAAFHLLRGTESVLRDFYFLLVKQKRCNLMWGPIIEDLRKRRKAKPYTVLLDNLDNIRRSFRNPTQHPEKIYDIEEVQDLWGLCGDVINRMAKDFPQKLLV